MVGPPKFARILNMLRAACSVLLPAGAFMLLSTTARAQEPMRHSKVTIHFDGRAEAMRQLGALGLAVDHGELIPGRSFTTDLSEREIGLARDAGFACEVLIEDVSSYYRARNAAGPPPEPRAEGWLCDGPESFPVPQHFTYGSMGGYYTWQEMLDVLDTMVALYPGLISAPQVIGTSIEGRPIHFVRISNDPNVDQAKPEVHYNALHHAREPGGLSQLIFFMWHLLENYGTDPEVTYLLDTRELYFVPCVNPDGYVYNETTDPGGGGMWRKNRRDNGDGSFGVDLNRNFGFLWGYDDFGSSPDPASEVYRGAAPFSEPETQAVRDFCNARQFRNALSYHTHGNMVIHPWGYGEAVLSVDSMLYHAHARLVTRNNGYVFGTTDEVLNYTVNGTTNDWMYGEEVTKPKIITMTPEAGTAGDGFWPPQSRIIPISAENLDANLLTAHLAGAYARTIDREPPVIETTTAMIAFDIECLGLDTADFTVTIEPLENVIGTGAPVAFPAMHTLEARGDSIEVFLDPSIAAGDELRYILAVSNGLFTHRDTIRKVFGQPQVLVQDDCIDLDDWDADDWGTTTEHWYSPPASFTDSPFMFYWAYASNELVYDGTIDLTGATSAALTFMARWDIQHNRDYAQVQVSPDGVDWTALCGLFTRPGSNFQDEGQPLFDGRQNEWVAEEMSLHDFLGQPLLLRFRLVSNGAEERDGFYVDDLRLISTGATIAGIDAAGGAGAITIMPDPAADMARIAYALPSGGAEARLEIHDALGAVIAASALPEGRGTIDLNAERFAPGLYHVSILGEGGPALHARLMVAR